MRLRVRRHPLATKELEDEAVWYELKQPGLGDDFLTYAQRALNDVLTNPRSWQKIQDWSGKPVLRSRGFTKFPFRLVYYTKGKKLNIIAYAHTSRKPNYWQDRVKDGADWDKIRP